MSKPSLAKRYVANRYRFFPTLLYDKLLLYLTGNSARNALIAADLVQNRAHYNLILSDRINHLETILALLPCELQQQAVLITGKSKPKEREQAMEDLRSGKKRYLFATYRLAKEGLDITRQKPNLSA